MSIPIGDRLGDAQRRRAFMLACRGYTAHQVALALGTLTRGIDWRGCSKGHMADEWSGTSIHVVLRSVTLLEIVAALETIKGGKS